MDNEDVGLHFAKQWYVIAKQLDPPRPVNTADGVAPTGTLPNPVDFRSAFFPVGNIPLGDPHMYEIDGEPTEP